MKTYKPPQTIAVHRLHHPGWDQPSLRKRHTRHCSRKSKGGRRSMKDDGDERTRSKASIRNNPSAWVQSIGLCPTIGTVNTLLLTTRSSPTLLSPSTQEARKYATRLAYFLFAPKPLLSRKVRYLAICYCLANGAPCRSIRSQARKVRLLMLPRRESWRALSS